MADQKYSHRELITLEMKAAHVACPAAVRQLMLRLLRRLLLKRKVARWLAQPPGGGAELPEAHVMQDASRFYALSIMQMFRYSSINNIEL
jgi:hypothetical protein